MKYEEAYCKGENGLFALNEVAYIFSNDAERYARNFEGKMYCPDCRNVPLTYANARRPYLRGFPNVDHDEGCIHTKREMTPEEIKDLLTKPGGEREVLHQMDRLVIQFLRNNSGDVAPNETNRPSINIEDLDAPTKIRWQLKTAIPRKQINAPFGIEDYEVEKLFYGRVHIKWEKAQTSDNMKLLIQKIATRKLICRLYVSAGVYRHIPKKFTNNSECDAFVVFMSALSKKDYEKSWSQGNLKKSTFLSINKLSATPKR